MARSRSRSSNSRAKKRKRSPVPAISSFAPPPADINVKRHRREKVQDVLGYNNKDNPFNDPTLTEKFIWKKRSEFLHAAGLYDKSDKRLQLQQVDGKIAEIERVKSRRDQRVVEQQMLEEQRVQRERELQQETFDDWESKEELFHLEQIRMKSTIRIEQGRERPVDLLYKALQIIDGKTFDDMELLATPPHLYIQSMHKDDLMDLRKDAKDFALAEETHRSEWEAIGTLCNDALESMGRGGVTEDSGIPANIVSEVHELLSGQSVKELQYTKAEVALSLEGRGFEVDTTFMEAVFKRIPFYVATRKVMDLHDRATKISYGPGGVKGVVKKKPILVEDEAHHHEAMATTVDQVYDSEPEENEETLQQFEPPLLPLDAFQKDDDNDVVILESEDDERTRMRIREQLIDLYSAVQDEGYALWKSERSRGFGADEANFNAIDGQVLLEPKKHDWDHKYQPRKPRFFNRVKTGYSWNKYNKAHFDYENPPPKHVCGYRFNIFYPDLIDKIKGTPKYHIENSTVADTVTIRFSAGPPYEDIAFRIVNREWMLGPRQGFRCVFDKGVLQLYFNVKRGWYKR